MPCNLNGGCLLELTRTNFAKEWRSCMGRKQVKLIHHLGNTVGGTISTEVNEGSITLNVPNLHVMYNHLQWSLLAANHRYVCFQGAVFILWNSPNLRHTHSGYGPWIKIRAPTTLDNIVGFSSFIANQPSSLIQTSTCPVISPLGLGNLQGDSVANL